MELKSIVACALASCGLLTLPAQAATSSSATLGGFTVTLFDLDLNDGITPYLTWTSGSFADFVGGSVFSDATNATAGSDTHSDIGPAFSSVAAHSNVGGRTTATGAVSGTGDFASHTLSASGHTQGSSQQGVAESYYASAQDATAFYAGTFTLSAHTRATFSVLSNVSASTSQGCVGVGGAACENSTAEATFLFSGDDGQYYYGNNQQTAAATLVPHAGGYHFIGQSAQHSQILGGSFENNAASATNGLVNGSVWVSGTTNIAAVPEPGTPAMLLAGLGVLGLVARRRS